MNPEPLEASTGLDLGLLSTLPWFNRKPMSVSAPAPCCSNFQIGMPRGPAAVLRLLAKSASKLELDETLRGGDAGGDLAPADLALRGRWLRPALHGGTIFSKRAKLSANV